MTRIGGASGFWGESDAGLPQLLAAGNLDYIVFDYLAEVTMSILARARAKSSEFGYATDFVSDAIAPNIDAIAKSGVRLLANAGGVNPEACAAAIRKVIDEAGLELKVAVVLGDDLTARATEFVDEIEMFSRESFPDPRKIASINAYLGAFPIAAALAAGADIVVTGRCVDSALTLGACIHEFGWQRNDWDRLAGGSLAGHLIECGPQACGGNFTDWEDAADTMVDIGYPLVEMRADGSFLLTKPEGTGGAVTRATAAEQLVYEIGDPAAYMLPDVACDFTQVAIREVAKDLVEIDGARGRPASEHYKVSATFADGWKIATLWFYIGEAAAEKARIFADAALARSTRKLEKSNLGGYSEVNVELMGDDNNFGEQAGTDQSREIVLKLAAKHQEPKALSLLLKEATGLALSAPPGLTLPGGGRPKPSPVIRLFSFLINKNKIIPSVFIDNYNIDYAEKLVAGGDGSQPPVAEPALPDAQGAMVAVPLRKLAWARSGDKGDKANIGVIARAPAFVPWLWRGLTTQLVAQRFAHLLHGDVERFFMPGLGAINFLLHDTLGGGGMASLRNDPQGKAFAQILLDIEIAVPQDVLKEAADAGV